MNARKIVALLTALALLLCGAALAEEEFVPEKTGVYTVFNKTGEPVTELKITDNVTGEENIFPFAEDEFLDEKGIAVFYVDIPENEDGEHRLTLSFKTESGREESFKTLSIEEINIDLLATDAMTGATPIAFSMPAAEKAGVYTFYNLTGEVVTDIDLTDNDDGAKMSFSFDNGLAPNDSFVVNYVVPADRENVTLTLRFVTESGKTGVFTSLKMEEVPISLLDIDALTGPTPISFTAPD